MLPCFSILYLEGKSKPWISHYDVYVIPIIWPIKCNLQKTVIMAITFYLCRTTAVDNRSELLFRFMELRKQWQKINKEDYFACLPSNANCCFLIPILPCYWYCLLINTDYRIIFSYNFKFNCQCNPYTMIDLLDCLAHFLQT